MARMTATQAAVNILKAEGANHLFGLPGALRGGGFDGVYTLLDEAATPRQAFDDPVALLRRIGTRLADRLHDA